MLTQQSREQNERGSKAGERPTAATNQSKACLGLAGWPPAQAQNQPGRPANRRLVASCGSF